MTRSVRVLAESAGAFGGCFRVYMGVGGLRGQDTALIDTRSSSSSHSAARLAPSSPSLCSPLVVLSLSLSLTLEISNAINSEQS